MTKPIDEGISRREALQGGSAAAVAVGAGLLSNLLIRRVQAASSGDPRILLGDAATDPDENGEFARNGADVKVQSGGTVRNLTSPTFDAVTTGSLTIGGKLFEQDSNSPLNKSGSSVTYSVGGSYRHVVVIYQTDTVPHDQLQVNGDTNSNYDEDNEDGTTTTGQTEWNINRPVIGFELIGDRSSAIRLINHRIGGTVVVGTNTNITSPISQFSLIDSGSTSRTIKARVFGRDMEI